MCILGVCAAFRSIFLERDKNEKFRRARQHTAAFAGAELARMKGADGGLKITRPRKIHWIEMNSLNFEDIY